jgi:hypothetical protein
MRHLLFVALLASCATPPPNTPERVAKKYASALLASDAATMQALVAAGVSVAPARRNPHAAALHVMRICPHDETPDGNRRNILVLVGGDLSYSALGIEMVQVRERGTWRVKDARLSTDPMGTPRLYLLNCYDSPSHRRSTYISMATSSLLRPFAPRFH